MKPPAELRTLVDWEDGVPVSRLFGDVYFSRESGSAETRHVFLGGNALREQWSRLAPRSQFLIGETGFGTALNFVCAWQLWDEAAPRDARLHFVSVEQYPLAPSDIARGLAVWPELAAYRQALLEKWEEFPPGWHRLVFAGGRVVLTLLIGEVAAMLSRLDAQADAWFLDGFAPAKNPGMWRAEVLVEVARLSRPDTTFATYTVAGEIRRGLEANGFAVEKRPGFGRKREMLCGKFIASRARTWRPPWFQRPIARSVERRAVVIGAGLAGTASAASFAARGWSVDLIERARDLASEASSMPQAALYARLSPHGTALSELSVAGLLHTSRLARTLLSDEPESFQPSGVLQLAYDPTEEARQERLSALGLPGSFVARLDRDDASALAGIELPSGGLWFPRAGWIHAPALCRALAGHPAIRVIPQREATTLRRGGDAWEIRDGSQLIARAPVAIIAAAGGSTTFPETAHLPLRLIRGQLTLVPETPASCMLRTVLCGEGYVAPARQGFHSLGATHKFHDTSTSLSAREHVENLDRLARLAPALYRALDASHLDPESLPGRAALRCSSPDYLPIVGPIVDASAFARAYAPLAHDARLKLEAPSPWLDGLYVNTAHGSRGSITAPLAGEILAAYLEDEPMPLPRSVVEALHPSRFLLRKLIRRKR
jgi:tRNA 5-methylaminomethyl-2-thiouridine biosynthesis bifunctional protein